MSGKMRLGIILASLGITAALVFGGANLTGLLIRWINEHQGMAKAMQLVSVLLLPVVAFILYRRRKHTTRSA